MSGERLGLAAEIKAIVFLRKQGLRVISMHVRSHHGEIDLIAAEKDTLVFVEVKAGKQPAGYARLRVTKEKQARIKNAAMVYLSAHPAQKIRFDILEQSAQGFELIRNAF